MSVIDWSGPVPPRGWGLKVSIRPLNAAWSQQLARVGTRLQIVGDEALWRGKEGLAHMAGALRHKLAGVGVSSSAARACERREATAEGPATASVDRVGDPRRDPAAFEDGRSHPITAAAPDPDDLACLWTQSAVQTAAVATAVVQASVAASFALMAPSLASWASAVDHAWARERPSA